MATLGQLAGRYLRQRRSTGELADGSVVGIRQVLGSFVDSVGHTRRPNRVSRRTVQRWVETQNVAPATLRNRISILRCFFRWAVREGHLRSDPTVGLARVKAPRAIPRALSRSKVAKVLAAAPDARGVVMVSLCVQEGLRVAEVAGLEMGDVNLEEDLLVIRKHKGRQGGPKGNHERIVPLTSQTRRAITHYLAERPAPSAGVALVRSTTRTNAGLAPSYVSQLISAWMHEAGVDESGHSLRHTAASDVLRKGGTLRQVQEILGHASLSATQRYLSWANVGELRAAMEGRDYLCPEPEM